MKLSHAQNRLRLISSYVKRQKDVAAYPISLIVENTAKCNLKCPMCPREFGYHPPEDFDFLLFKRIIDEVTGRTELIFPWGGGEPLLNPDLYRMIRYCKDAGIYTVVSTNGTLLNEARGRALLESDLDNLIIAFDGTTPEVYEKYRKGARFEKVKEKILAFLELKKQTKSDIFVVIQMVRLPGNLHQVSDFHRMWRLEGVDETRVKEDEIIIRGVGLEERRNGHRRRNPCYQLWQGPATVNYKGDFFPCCHAWRSDPFGNVNETSIYNLWNSDRMRAIRRAHLEGDLSGYPDCLDCHAPNPRLPVILGSFLVDTARVRRWIPRMERLAHFHGLPFFRDR
jgi:radical SAM protein with 4Fe4S-binding SPASM domain